MTIPRWEETERRRPEDRRRLTVRTLAYGFLYGRRRSSRRGEEDGAAVFVDWLESHIFFISLAVFTLSCIDAAFTLSLIDIGATEANPIMKAALSRGIMFFLVSKMVLTAGGLFFLVSLGNLPFFCKFRVNSLLYLCLFMYLALICYELILFRVIPA